MDLDNTILVVEDERALSLAVKDLLENEGFDVVSARSVEQALGYMDEVKMIKAVWLDHYLIGEKNGLDFLAEVRERENKKDIPVFVVTNTGGHEKEHTYMNLGANKYYIKVNSKLSEIVSDIKKELQKIK
jgi:two-component system response regulator CpxR